MSLLFYLISLLKDRADKINSGMLSSQYRWKLIHIGLIGQELYL